jgi:outer membrane lipoprotein-sorting protein
MMKFRTRIAVFKTAFRVALAAALLCPAVGAQESTHDVDTIMKRIDELYRSESSYSVVEMEIVTPNYERTLRMRVWTEGMDRTFVRIDAPKKEQGMGTLRIDNEMWNYLPKTNKVMKVPPSMMMGSWMGSDFTNDDLVNEFTYREDYTCEWATVESPQPEVLYIKCIPREGVPVVWGHLVMALRESDYIPLWERYYDEKGRPMRRIEFSDIRHYNDRLLPGTMSVIPENKEGHKTVMRYETAEFDVGIDGDVFSLRNLRSAK